jgi:hypothetical protein
MLKTYLTFLVLHEEHIKDLSEKAAGRIYTLQGVDDCQVVTDFPAVNEPAEALPNGHGESNVIP